MATRHQQRVKKRATQHSRRLPDRSSAAQRAAQLRLAWYVGLGLMACSMSSIGLPIAIAVAVGHEIARRARTEALRELIKGVEAGA
jgi:hypothetical protein